ncbi:MAG TPA: transglycosylase SLT domain-containing protein [Bryobacteraceae bacterium]|nr:transglycosylase SLT domain-containing protein [Bryobacteraceae bacterium]
MDVRMKTFCSFFVISTVLTSTGCGYLQQSKFQTSFLPPAPHTVSPVADIAPPDVIHPNPLLRGTPAVLLTETTLPKRRTNADALAQRAEDAFNRGKKLYSNNDMPAARAEFDSAIDLMLEASGEDPGFRDEYCNQLDDMIEAIHRYDLTGLGAAAVLEQGKFEKAPLEDIVTMTFPVDPKIKDKVREQVASTASQLPLTVNDTVLGYINYFSNRGRGTILAATERSGRYRPMIQRIFEEVGVPQELIHLAQAESGFIPRAISRAAAGGMWQFVVSRGQQYGLMQTRYTDDRMDPEKATRAAAMHLRDLYSEFGDWYLAMAAYNCGPGVVEKAVERTGYADFWELRSRGMLPLETANYVPIILAMTIMEKNPVEYGLQGIPLDSPVEYDTVEMRAATSIALIGDVTEVSMAELAELNPAVLKGMVPQNYPVHVPKGLGKQLFATLEQVPVEHRDSWRMYRVGPGDTLASVSKRFGTTPAAIAAANNLHGADAAEGAPLLIPVALRPETPARQIAARTQARRTAAAVHPKGKTSASKAPAASTTSRKPQAIVARSASN